MQSNVYHLVYYLILHVNVLKQGFTSVIIGTLLEYTLFISLFEISFFKCYL